MVELGYFALFLLLTGCIAAGVIAGVIHTWSLRAVTYSLSARVDVVEGILSREVKARAGQERWKKPAVSAAQLQAELAAIAPPVAARPVNWWENPNIKKGAHVG
jgi:hypothetical protein